jgi:hypothetical protein
VLDSIRFLFLDTDTSSRTTYKSSSEGNKKVKIKLNTVITETNKVLISYIFIEEYTAFIAMQSVT